MSNEEVIINQAVETQHTSANVNTNSTSANFQVLFNLPPEYNVFKTFMPTRGTPLTFPKLSAMLSAAEELHDTTALAATHRYNSHNSINISNHSQNNNNNHRGPPQNRNQSNFNNGSRQNHGGNYRGGGSNQWGNFNRNNRPRYVNPNDELCQICKRDNHLTHDCYYRNTNKQALVAASSAQSLNPWHFDSGATNHITHDFNNLSFSSNYNGPDIVAVGNGSSLHIYHTGPCILAEKRIEIIDLLITRTTLEASTLNANGLTDPSSDPYRKQNWLEQKRNALMVVASLIATMAFQASSNDHLHHDVDEDSYNSFMVYNTVGFVASLSIILLLISGIPLKNRVFMWIPMVIMWVAIISMAFAYLFSLSSSALAQNASTTLIIGCSVYAWIGFLLLSHTIRLIVKLVKYVISKLKGKRHSDSMI